MGRPNRGTGSAGPKKPNPPINRPQYGNGGKVCKGEIYNYDCAKNVFDKYVRNINSSITVWDVYVAINAQYHDYIRLYSEWFRNINKNELDNKIIESAITFYFKDEDSSSTKTWNYFKTAN